MEIYEGVSWSSVGLSKARTSPNNSHRALGVVTRHTHRHVITIHTIVTMSQLFSITQLF